MRAMTVVTFTMLVLGTASVAAGPCSQEIADVSKKLAASDAGSGPTIGSPAPIAADQKGQHPGTSLMSKETEGKANLPRMCSANPGSNPRRARPSSARVRSTLKAVKPSA